MTWQKKCSGSRAISDLIDRLNDGSDEKRGAELEAASDAIASIVKQTDTEMDQRTKLSNRSPRPNPMLAKIPIFKIAPRLRLTMVTVMQLRIVLLTLCAQAILTEHGRNLIAGYAYRTTNTDGP